MARKSSSHRSLRDPFRGPVREISIPVALHAVVLLTLRDRWHSSRFGGGPEPCQEMGATGAWSRNRGRRLGLIDGRDVRGRHAQPFNVGTLSPRGKTGGGNSQGAPIVESRIVSHLSKTTGVHAQGQVVKYKCICARRKPVDSELQSLVITRVRSSISERNG